jgi:hypothetical protein
MYLVISQKIQGTNEQPISIPKMYAMDEPGLPYGVWVFKALIQFSIKTILKNIVNIHEKMRIFSFFKN